MIDRTLPPVRLGVEGDYGDLLQSLMLSYLARYSSGEIDFRTAQCYYRAFGIDTLQFWPRVNGGRPGFLLAKIPLVLGNHYVVAIEGMTSLNQMWTWSHLDDGMVPLTGRPGHVFSFVANYAAQIGDILQTYFAGGIEWGNPLNDFTFAGHSLGASVAQVLASNFQYAYRAASVRVRGFGGLKHGSSAWYGGMNSRILTAWIYLENDPTFYVNFSGICYTSSGTFGIPYRDTRCFAPYEMQWVTLSGLTAATPNQGSVGPYFASTANLLRAFDRSNPWWFHWADTYRLMAMRLAARERDLLELRINYLEHPNENKWQNVFSPDNEWDESWFLKSDPPPEVYTQATGEQIRETTQRQHTTPLPPQPPTDPRLIGPPMRIADRVLSLQRRRNQHNPIGVP